jgi:hypothetical protein
VAPSSAFARTRPEGGGRSSSIGRSLSEPETPAGERSPRGATGERREFRRQVGVLAYENAYTPLKQRLVGARERNFPLDALVYVLPVGLVLSVDAVAPLAATQLTVSNGWTRVGCFSGGCWCGVGSPVGRAYLLG